GPSLLELVLLITAFRVVAGILLAPLVQAPGAHPQAGRNVSNLVATLSRLAHRFDLEFLGKSLLHGIRTHDNSSTPHYEARGCLVIPGRFNHSVFQTLWLHRKRHQNKAARRCVARGSRMGQSTRRADSDRHGGLRRMGRDGRGVAAASESSIQITFQYRGRRCREKSRLKPTPANPKRAERHRAAILVAIEAGTFDYAATIPDSPTAARFADLPGQVLTTEQYLTD